jgi:hypothetical protein
VKKLFTAILHAAQLTADVRISDERQLLDRLTTIFSAQKLMFNAINNPNLKAALLNSDHLVGTKLSHTFIAAAAMIEDVAQFQPIMTLVKNIQTAWKTVQQRKADPESMKVYDANDLVTIMRALVPTDISVADRKLMESFIDRLRKCIRNLPSSIYEEFESILTSIQGGIIMTLPVAERPNFYPPSDDNEDKLNEPLLSEPEEYIDSDDDIATVEILKAQDVKAQDVAEQKRLILNKHSLNDEQLLKIHNTKVEMLYELNAWFMVQNELILAHQIAEQCKQYKSVLANYILQELAAADSALFFNYFGPESEGLRADKIAAMATIFAKNDDQLVNAQEVSIKTFAKNNMNVSRAIANYALVHRAEIKLAPSNQHENKPEHLIERLKGFYQVYPEIEQNLKMVGNEAVDNATSGFMSFFKKIWSSVTWYFSDAGKKEREFKASAQYHRQRFFKVLENQPIAEPELALDEPQQDHANGVEPIIPAALPQISVR